MEIKVREVGEAQTKSVQEVENELLAKHEEEISQGETTSEKNTEEATIKEAPKETPKEAPVVEAEKESSSLKEEDVLSYIKNRYDKQIDSVDQLFSEREQAEDLPEDVSAYLKYKKETGRGINDFMKLNEDFDDLDDNTLLARYYANKEDGLDGDDISFMIEEEFGYDKEIDEESDIRRKKVAKKKELAKAKNFFEDQKEKYKAPLESSPGVSSTKDQEEINAYKEYQAKVLSAQEDELKKYEWFQKKTDEYFNNEFKGFEFKVNDRDIVYSPAEAAEIKKTQSDLNNFISKYVNKDGVIDDAKGYHKALAMAMNPERAAKFFYEQGMADAVDNVARKSKNINMDIRQAPQTLSKGGFNVKSVSNDSGRGLRIRSNKNK